MQNASYKALRTGLSIRYEPEVIVAHFGWRDVEKRVEPWRIFWKVFTWRCLVYFEENAGTTFQARAAKMGYVQDQGRFGLCVNRSGILSEPAAKILAGARSKIQPMELK